MRADKICEEQEKRGGGREEQICPEMVTGLVP